MPEPYDFSPLADDPSALVLDLTAPGTRPASSLDDADAAAVAGLDAVSGPVALWRSWRSDGERVYLLEHAGDEAPDGFSAYRTGSPLTTYQRAVRARSALLWAAEPASPVRTARVFDSYDPVLGGQFAADHPVISAGDELTLVLEYLSAGTVLLGTDTREADVFDEDAGPVVPMSFRTDGRWIWTDAVAYYLRTYALAPDAGLLADMRARDYQPPRAGPVALHRALVALAGGA
jgi:hypothetical protein